MKFEVFSVLLVPTEQRDLFETDGRNRRQILRDIFCKRRDFTHHGNDFCFAPTTVQHPNPDILVGKIGKRTLQISFSDPDQGFAETEEPGWIASETILNTSEDRWSGQIMAMEYRADVGKPSAILSSMALMFNELRITGPFTLHIQPISIEKNFWTAMEKYSSNGLTKLSFQMIAPNIGRAGEKTRDLMNKYKSDENIDSAKLELKNEKGALNAMTETVTEYASYVLTGAGRLVAMAGRQKIFDSKDNIKSTSIDKDNNHTIVDRADQILPHMKARDEE